MLYRFAHVLMWITFRIFFNRIDVVGKGQLAKDSPMILIANHPASFLDAMVLAVFLNRSLHFYVRGDIFRHPLAYRVLTWLHMIPIYSQEHGTQHLWRNQRTFDRGRNLLSRGKLLLIFPEGFSRLSKQLVPLKKGAARVALQTAFGGDKQQSLLIQTVAINYAYHGFGADLLIRVGEHQGLQPYHELFLSQPAHAISALTRDMQELFQRNVIHVRQGERTGHAETLIRIATAYGHNHGEEMYLEAKRICERVSDHTRERFEEMDADLGVYRSRLQQLGLKETTSLDPRQPDRTSRWIKLVLLFPLYIIGVMIWYMPGTLSKWIANKTVTRIDFYTSVHSAVMAFVGLLWWMTGCVLFYNFGCWIATLIMFISPAMSYMALRWRFEYEQWKTKKIIDKMAVQDPDMLEDLLSLRKRLLYD